MKTKAGKTINLSLIFLLYLGLSLSCASTVPAFYRPVPQSMPTEKEYPTMRVWGRFLYTAFNEKIILRGINQGFIWIDRFGERTMDQIAMTGANAVRIVWSTSGSVEDLDYIIIQAIRQKMIPIVELHDATGKWENLKLCVDYWVSKEVVEVVQRHQKYLIVNIGNEIGDKNVTFKQFYRGYAEAIERIRGKGIEVPLMIDAPDWGKDIETIKACAAALIKIDPIQNLLFSIHMWWPKMWGYSEDRVRAEIKAVVELNIPLVVGEFGNAWEESEEGQIPYRVIIEECQKHEIGWLAWSWGPGNKPQTWLDMTEDGSFETLRGWGKEVALTSPFSIKNTALKPPSLANICEKGIVPLPLAP